MSPTAATPTPPVPWPATGTHAPPVVLVGPTGVGKTEVACALAEQLDAEIISCDSMQVYCHMAVLTQQPTDAQRLRVAHHLVHCVQPFEAFSVAQFRERATAMLTHIRARGKRVLLVGGTGLYVRALLDGLCLAPPADLILRARLMQQSRTVGPEALHAFLAQLDPLAASRIQRRDLRRIIRALEVFTLTGQPLSRLWEQTEGLSDREPVIQCGLTRPRETLYRRIDERTTRLLQEGAVEEVRALRERSLSQTARQVLGFNEISGALEGHYNWAEAQRLLARNTRHYARRQLIWFRRDKRIQWYEAQPFDTTQAIAERLLQTVEVAR